MFSALVLSGQAIVLEQASLLERLADRHGQAAAMNWLGHFLTTSSFQWKEPYLVLIVRKDATASSLSLDDVHAAVLLFEYRMFGLPTGFFSTDDWAGFRTVVSPEAERAVIATMAADALLERGAQAVLISYGHAEGETKAVTPTSRRSMRYTWQTRPVAMTLPLEPTIQATLAKLGKSTRFNLRYYRRRLLAAVPSEFVGNAFGMLEKSELVALNAGSLNPVAVKECLHQYESASKLPGGFLLGLRSAQGHWLSLIGGWRQSGVTVLHWQMNAAGYEKLSIGTAMRSYFLQHEVEQGAKRLIYYGGTPHSMGNSFLREEVTDLIVVRRTWRAAAVDAIVCFVRSKLSFLRVNSQLAYSICNEDLDWQTTDANVSEQSRQSSQL